LFSSSDISTNNKMYIKIITRVEYQFSRNNPVVIPKLDLGGP